MAIRKKCPQIYWSQTDTDVNLMVDLLLDDVVCVWTMIWPDEFRLISFLSFVSLRQKPNIKLHDKFLSLEAYGFGSTDNGPHEYYFEINLFEAINEVNVTANVDELYNVLQFMSLCIIHGRPLYDFFLFQFLLSPISFSSTFFNANSFHILGIDRQHFECWFTIAICVEETKSRHLVVSSDSSTAKTKLDSCKFQWRPLLLAVFEMELKLLLAVFEILCYHFRYMKRHGYPETIQETKRLNTVTFASIIRASMMSYMKLNLATAKVLKP